MSGWKDSHATDGVATSMRHDWMYLARGIAIVLVVIRHSGEIFRRTEFHKPDWLQAMDYALGPFRIPLLIFLSGILLDRSLNKGLGKFVEGKIKNLLWPFLVWTVLYVFVTDDFENLLNATYVVGGNYLWYLGFLAIYFGVAATVARVPHLIVASFAIAIAMLMPDGTRYGERLFLLMSYFFLGAFAGQNLDRFTRMLRNRWTPWLGIVAVCFSAMAVMVGGVKYETETAPLAIISIVAFCSIAYLLQHSRLVRPIAYVGKHSLIYYVVHFPTSFLVLYLLEFLGVFSVTSFLLISIPVSFLVPTLIVWSTKRSPSLRPLFEMPIKGTLLTSPIYRKTFHRLDRLLGVSSSRHRVPIQ